MTLLEVQNVHFIGIGGYGMSALAQVLLKLGYRVSGSDMKESLITNRLVEQGAQISLQHSRENIGDSELIVYSTAIPKDNPELSEARERGIPIWHRSELLAVLINEHYGIAVAGTHGKTTTTAMVALLLEQGGLDPTAIVGGIVESFGGNARLGKSRYLVAEACESDNSFMRYYPYMALVTNMEPDHLEHYNGDYNRLKQAYEAFLNHLHPAGTAVLCMDDTNLRELAAKLERKVVTYSGGDNNDADYSPRQISMEGFGSTFALYRGNTAVTGPIKLQVPGRHNISNAVGALAVAGELGLNLAKCAAALENFQGAGRRFQVLGEVGGIVVVDDYAHHPTEVRVTIEAAAASGKRICSIFQPHRYTRTAFFFEDFAHAFDGADLVLLHEVYSAGETYQAGATSQELAKRIGQVKGGPVHASDNMEQLADLAISFARPGDMILVMGAGDISRLAYSILKRLKEAVI